MFLVHSSFLVLQGIAQCPFKIAHCSVSIQNCPSVKITTFKIRQNATERIVLDHTTHSSPVFIPPQNSSGRWVGAPLLDQWLVIETGTSLWNCPKTQFSFSRINTVMNCSLIPQKSLLHKIFSFCSPRVSEVFVIFLHMPESEEKKLTMSCVECLSKQQNTFRPQGYLSPILKYIFMIQV